MRVPGDVPAAPAAPVSVEATPVRETARPQTRAGTQMQAVTETVTVPGSVNVSYEALVYAPDVIVGSMPVAGARMAPLMQTVVRPRVRARGGGTTHQRVYYVAAPSRQIVAESVGDHRRLLRRRPFLENRISDLRRKLENMSQLADIKRSYAAQLRASIRPGQRMEAALLDSGRFDGALNAVRGQLAALESELSSVMAKLVTSALGEAMTAEGAVFAMRAMMPNEATVVESEVEMVVEFVPAVETPRDP